MPSYSSRAVRPAMTAFRPISRPAARPHVSLLAAAIHLALAGGLMAAALPPNPVQAATPAVPQTDQTQVRRYDIPAGPLDAALTRFVAESGVPLAATPEMVQGRRSQGVQGSFTAQQALDRLLAGTGLAGRLGSAGSYVLMPAPHPADATQLSAITITGESLGATTEGTDSYTTGSMSSATGFNLSMRETPQSVSVVTRQQMDDQGLTDSASALERSTGISRNQNESDRTYISARGFDVTKFQYDGLPSKDYFDYDSEVLSDTAIYDRIEIVRGATGLLGGTGEPSATINFVRKKPTADFQGYGQLSAGSWHRKRGEIDVSGPMTENGKLRGRLVGAYTDRKSYLDHYKNSLGALYGILEADLPADTLLSVGIDYQKSETRGVTYGAPVPYFYADGSRTDFSRSTSTAADWTSLDRQRLAAFASLEKSFDNNWKAKAQYAYRSSKASPKLLYMYGYPERDTGTGVGTFSTSYDITHRAHALDLQVSGPFSLLNREHELVAGLAYYKRQLDYEWHPLLSSAPLDSFHDRGSYPEPVFGGGYNQAREQTSHEKSAYLAVRWHLLDPVRLITGIRWTNADYEQHFNGVVTSYEYNGEWTPYAGLVYDFARDYSAYVSYTRIFETQASRDRNGALLPAKTGTNYEAGIKGELLNGALNLSVAAFRMEQDNLAEFDTVVDGESRYKAIKGATVRGYELEVSGEISRGWQIAAGFTHQKARNAQGDKLQTIVPDSLLRLTTSYQLPGEWNKWTIGGHLTWQSGISEQNVGPNGENATQGAYSLVHLFGSYQASKNLTLHLAINNLFDKTYYTSIVEGYGRYGDPRNITASVKYRF